MAREERAAGSRVTGARRFEASPSVYSLPLWWRCLEPDENPTNQEIILSAWSVGFVEIVSFRQAPKVLEVRW